jgi:hypothetical protein
MVGAYGFQNRINLDFNRLISKLTAVLVPLSLHTPGFICRYSDLDGLYTTFFYYNVFQLPSRTPPPPLCELARPAGWGFEYMLYYWAK